MRYFVASHFAELAANFLFVGKNFCVGALKTVRSLNFKITK